MVMWCYCVSLVGVGVLRCLAIRVWLSVAQSQAKYLMVGRAKVDESVAHPYWSQ